MHLSLPLCISLFTPTLPQSNPETTCPEPTALPCSGSSETPSRVGGHQMARVPASRTWVAGESHGAFPLQLFWQSCVLSLLGVQGGKDILARGQLCQSTSWVHGSAHRSMGRGRLWGQKHHYLAPLPEQPECPRVSGEKSRVGGRGSGSALSALHGPGCGAGSPAGPSPPPSPQSSLVTSLTARPPHTHHPEEAWGPQPSLCPSQTGLGHDPSPPRVPRSPLRSHSPACVSVSVACVVKL